MTWMFVAYIVIWLAVFIYVFDMGKKQRAIAQEIEGLKAKIAQGDKG
jgi:CcmD family protein